MNDVFPAPPRSFYRAFMVSLALHLLLATSLMVSRGSSRYINPGSGRTKVIWVKPAAGKAPAAKSKALPAPPTVATPPPKANKALTKTEDKKKSAKKDRALEKKMRNQALKEIAEAERKKLLASALSGVKDALETTPPATAKDADSAGAEGEGDGAGAEGNGLIESEYDRQVREIYIREMNVLYKTRFSGKGLSAKVKVEIDGEGNVMKHRLVENSGNLYFDAAVRVIMERVKNLPPPPAEYVAQGINLDFSPP